jgi:hypothetical protein
MARSFISSESQKILQKPDFKKSIHSNLSKNSFNSQKNKKPVEGIKNQ